jgi:protein ImuB
MIACLSVPAFDLRVVLRSHEHLRGQPIALAPAPEGLDAIGACTHVAVAAGLHEGMTMGEALAMCPDLVLVEQDPATVASEWESLLRRLEAVGLAVEPLETGHVLFETTGTERLTGGLRAVLESALVAAGREWQPRLGVAARRFAALAAAGTAAAGRAHVVDDNKTALFLEPLPLDLLPLSTERRQELSALGVRQLGELASLPRASVADRLGPEGDQAWLLARAEDRARVMPRKPPADLSASVEFPDPIANTFSLEHALSGILNTVLAHPDRKGQAPRKLTLTARLTGGGSWRRAITLREPTADVGQLRLVLSPRLSEIAAPALDLRIEIVELAEVEGMQEELIPPQGARLRERLREGLRQVRASVGRHAVCTVVEVAPWSRIPESRAMLVPRDD